MPVVEFERRLVKSVHEVWDDVRSDAMLKQWLGDVQVSTSEPPHRLEWTTPAAQGAIRLESSGWGTTVRVQAEPRGEVAWERLQMRYALERSLLGLLDDLARRSLRGNAF